MDSAEDNQEYPDRMLMHPVRGSVDAFRLCLSCIRTATVRAYSWFDGLDHKSKKKRHFNSRVFFEQQSR